MSWSGAGMPALVPCPGASHGLGVDEVIGEPSGDVDPSVADVLTELEVGGPSTEVPPLLERSDRDANFRRQLVRGYER